MSNFNTLDKKLKWLKYSFVAILLIPFFYYLAPIISDKLNETAKVETTVVEESAAEIILAKGSVDPENGLIVDDNYKLVEQNCSACHSLKLVTQNRADKDGWKEIIVWMQETQKLWDLGKNEPLILDYLGKNYANTKKGRRLNLENIDWYEL